MLLDSDRVLGVVQPSFGATPLVGARVRYLEYDPGRSILVTLAVTAGETTYDVVVSSGRLRPSDDQPALVAGARGHRGQGRRRHRPRGGGRQEPETPLAEWGEPPVVVAWYPVDVGLPLLASPTEMSALLRLRPGQVRRLAWMPQQRAVLRVGDVVVKLQRTPQEAERTVDTMLATADWLPTARLVNAEVASGAVVQTALPGHPLTRMDAVGAGREAAAMIRRLHNSPVATKVDRPPGALLEQCRPVLGLVAFACPDLHERIEALVRRLEDTAPAGSELVPSHGDFTMGQLLRAPEGTLTVVDTDTLCRAPAAYDLGSYAANLVSGRDDDLAAARFAVGELLDGYGSIPDGLDWYLAAGVLRRLDRALRRAKKDWQVRTARTLDAAEALAPR